MSTHVHELKNLFASTLDIPIANVTDDLTYNSIVEWDSVAHMALIAAIEDRFSIMLDTNDILDMSSFAKSIEIVRKYGVDI